MALQHYDIRLRHRRQDVASVDVFSRHLDFDDPEQMSAVDGLLVKLLVDSVKRAGGKVEELWQYDLRLFKHGKSGVEMTFVASASEVPEELR